MLNQTLVFVDRIYEWKLEEALTTQDFLDLSCTNPVAGNLLQYMCFSFLFGKQHPLGTWLPLLPPQHDRSSKFFPNNRTSLPLHNSPKDQFLSFLPFFKSMVCKDNAKSPLQYSKPVNTVIQI